MNITDLCVFTNLVKNIVSIAVISSRKCDKKSVDITILSLVGSPDRFKLSKV